MLGLIDRLKQTHVSKEVIEQSKVHEAINLFCKNRFAEKSKPDLFEKVKELKNHWRETLRQQDINTPKDNVELQDSSDGLYFGRTLTNQTSFFLNQQFRDSMTKTERRQSPTS